MQVMGIPRALFYYHFHPLWGRFFQELGFQVVFSPPTNKQILEWGLSSCVDGACLPVKAYIGHCQALVRQGVELLFVPQIISICRGEYICPNFMGLPDLVRQYLPSSVGLISPSLNGRRGGRSLERSYRQMGRAFASRSGVKKAWQKAFREQIDFESGQQNLCPFPGKEKLKILLLGPRYLTDDVFLNGNLTEKLKGLGAAIFTAAQLSDRVSYQASQTLVKRLFWTGGRRSIGALEHFQDRLDGVVCIAPFGCGAESLLGPLVEQRLRRRQLPKLELNIDEHTSEVGMVTRLEAFCDLLERNKMP